MDITGLIDLQGTLFLLMIIGIILSKLNYITAENKEMLTDLVINLFLPCSIIHSFQIEFDPKILKGMVVIFGVTVFIQLGCTLLAKVLYIRQPDHKKSVMQYGTICSNAGFIGMPIAESVFGKQGLLFASIFLIPQRIVMWSVGASYFRKKSRARDVVFETLTHPCIVSVYIGLLLLFFCPPVPAFLNKTIQMLGNCATPMSMIIIGAIIPEIKNTNPRFDRSIVYYLFIRHFLIPFLTFTLCNLCGVDSLLTGVAVLLTAMPAGNTTTVVALKYGGDYIFATECVVLSTVLSLVTIPLWCLVLI